MQRAFVLGFALVMAACGQRDTSDRLASATGPTPISTTGGVSEPTPNAVPVPAPVVQRRIYVANVAPEPLTVVQGPTPTEAGMAVALEGTAIPLACSCPGGRRDLRLETLTLGLVIDLDSRSGRAVARATITGDWNGDGEEDRIVLPPAEGELQLVLREDEVWALRVVRDEATSAGETAWQLEVSLVNDGSWRFTLDGFKSVSGMDSESS